MDSYIDRKREKKKDCLTSIHTTTNKDFKYNFFVKIKEIMNNSIIFSPLYSFDSDFLGVSVRT